MADVSISGLISGIDTDSIVSGLLEIQQAQIDRIELKKAELLSEQAAFAGLEAALVTFRSDVSRLAKIAGSELTKNAVTVSDETAVSATASDSAVPGTYQFTVDAVARAHQIATQGFTDEDAEITTGTLDLRVGSGDLITVTIDSTNNTLQGLADAINASGAGVNASIVEDSSGGATPYRLLLTSSQTGTDNAISITNNLTGGSGTQPVFDTGNPVQAAADAQVTIGSGPGAISVSSSSNRFDSLIGGVSIDLLGAASGTEITVTVARDTDAAVEAVSSFVDSFNAVISYISERSQYDAETEEAGILLGSREAQSIQQELQSAVTSVVPGVSSDLNQLGAIGISVTDQGTLQFSPSTLENVLNGNVAGVGPDDVKRLFALDGQSSATGVSFVVGSSSTKPSGSTPYEVDITQAATQASLTAGTDLAASTVITSANRTLDIDLDGTSATITLDEGTYTRQELADHLEAVINGSSELAGRTVSVGLSGNRLQITSDSYGSSSSLLLSGGTALTDLGFTAGAAEVGTDVAGSFVVNGVTEPATGSGQLLIGNADNENTADLQVRVTLSAGQITAGSEAQLTVTQGLAAGLDTILNEFLDPVSGTLTTIDDTYNDQIESLQASIDRQQAIFDQQQENLIQEFIALESALAELQNTSQFLGSQLQSLSLSSS